MRASLFWVQVAPLDCTNQKSVACRFAMSKSESTWEVDARSSGYYFCIGENEHGNDRSNALDVAVTEKGEEWRWRYN